MDNLVCEHCCHPATFKHRERQQQPYRGYWQALVAWEHEQNPDGVPTPLRMALNRIVDQPAYEATQRTENTTRYGRETVST